MPRKTRVAYRLRNSPYCFRMGVQDRLHLRTILDCLRADKTYGDNPTISAAIRYSLWYTVKTLWEKGAMPYNPGLITYHQLSDFLGPIMDEKDGKQCKRETT